MTELRSNMMRLIAQMPEENLLKVMAYLETSGIAAAFRKSQELIDSQALAEAHKAAMAAQGSNDAAQSMAAYEDLQKYRRRGTEDVDYKAEYRRARAEKYAHLG